MQELYNRLIKDLKRLNVIVDFTLELRGYSKSYFGRYNPNTSTIVIYVYEDEKCSVRYPYEDIFKTLLHELTHHIQWTDKNFVRYKGVMHNEDFHIIYNSFLNRLEGDICENKKTGDRRRTKLKKIIK